LSLAQNSQPLDLEEALGRLYETLPVINSQQQLDLGDALGRILAEDVLAPINLPPFPASAMDGYALAQQDFVNNPGQAFTVVGESLAGHPYTGRVGPGQCVRIFTGAKVPDGADQIILQEERLADDKPTVRFQSHQPSESYVRPIGHDVETGQCLARKGEPLSSFVLGSLAASGVNQVQVYGLPRVGVFSTGDELVDPGTPPEQLRDGQIYDSNRFTVLQLLHNSPCELIDLGRLPDNAHAVRTAFEDAVARCDLLITSGGVSVGDADFITHTIATLGQLDFWRLNLKPGKPLAFGRIHNCYVFGLPGNPVSTIVTLLMLAKPAIAHYAGAQPRSFLRVSAQLDRPLAHTPGRTEYQRGTLQQHPNYLGVTGTGDQSSNRLRTFYGADCLIEVPKTAGDMATGEQVWVLPFSGLLD
jgi:molybdopterin molybdotransferase